MQNKILMMLLFGGLTAYLAKGRGRNPVVWFMIGFFFGIFALLFLFIFPSVKDGRTVSFGRQPSPKDPTTIETVATEVASPNITPEDTTTIQDKNWFYLDSHNKQYGPMPFSELKAKWQQGNTTSNTYVWTAGMIEWQCIKDTPELLKALW
jgi:hypothetical protein